MLRTTVVGCFAVALLAICLVSAAAGAQPVVESVPAVSGQVNWSNGVLQATGAGVRPPDAVCPAQARLLARRAAVADAYRNMAHLINEVRVTSATTVERYVAASDTVRLSVEAHIRGAVVVEEQEAADGAYRVTLQANMAGRRGLTRIVLPRALETGTAPPGIDIKPIPSPPVASLPSLPGAGLEKNLLTGAGDRGPFTGLIIDARGLNVQPAMSPRIYDETGKEIYSGVRVDPGFAEEVGIAGYMGTIRAAMGLQRVGNRPLVIRAVATPDRFHRYVTISAADGQRILTENAVSRFLEKAMVIIVVDERRARDEGP